jgi:hypothetical protein
MPQTVLERTGEHIAKSVRRLDDETKVALANNQDA